MKATLKFPLFCLSLLSALTLLSGCLDEESNPVISQNVIVKADSLHESTLGYFEADKQVEIEIRPSHALVSEITQERSGEIRYKYQAEPTFRGKDFVQIREVKVTSNSLQPSIKITKITFVVEG